jgi:hypothetical protein
MTAGASMLAQPAAALPAGLDLDGEHLFEALCAGHRPLSACDRCLAPLAGAAAAQILGPVEARSKPDGSMAQLY